MKTTQTDSWTNGMKVSLMVRQTDKWTDEETRGQTDRQIGRQKDRWKDGMTANIMHPYLANIQTAIDLGIDKDLI